jgi:hypothetical protein
VPKACCTISAAQDARRNARTLGIAFSAFDPGPRYDPLQSYPCRLLAHSGGAGRPALTAGFWGSATLAQHSCSLRARHVNGMVHFRCPEKDSLRASHEITRQETFRQKRQPAMGANCCKRDSTALPGAQRRAAIALDESPLEAPPRAACERALLAADDVRESRCYWRSDRRRIGRAGACRGMKCNAARYPDFIPRCCTFYRKSRDIFICIFNPLTCL